MTMVRGSARKAQPDAISEAVSPDRVQETASPNDVLKISRYLEPPAGASTEDKAAEAESDSNDSLFITQKPVPRAERSRRRLPRSQRSRRTSLIDPQEDDFSSASDGESETVKRTSCKQKRPRLPKYTFPFLTGKSSRGPHPACRENASLHNYGMGGFFKCVRELWQSYQSGDDLQSSLPTVDMDGENISPLSETEEGWSGSEDIRVVKKKCFLAPSKAKGPQPWCNPEKADHSINQKSDNKHEHKMSQGRQRNIPHKIPAKASTSRSKALSSTESSDDGGTSHRLLDDRGKDDTSSLSPSETPKTKRRLTRRRQTRSQRKEREEDVCDDSDATVCEPLQRQGVSSEHTLTGRDVSPNLTEPQADVFHMDDLSQTGQAEEEPESQSLLQSPINAVSATNSDSVCNEASVMKKKKKKKHPPEPPAAQATDELQTNGEKESEKLFHDDVTAREEERHSPDSQQVKKKRKKKRDGVGQAEASEVRAEEDALISQTCHVEDGRKEKKKKKKKRIQSVEDDVDADERLQPSAVPETLDDEDEVRRKKKRRKKEKKAPIAEDMTSELAPISTGEIEEVGQCLEKGESSQEGLEVSYDKKTNKHKRKRLSAPQDDNAGADAGADAGEELSSSNNATSGEITKRKKKKKKKSSDDAELVSKKKSPNDAEDAAAQSDDLVSAQEKKKKKRRRRPSSFPVSDSEEDDAQTHEEPRSPFSKRAAGPVCGADRPGVSAAAVETESAEMGGNLEASKNVVRKKERKRKISAAQESNQPDPELPEATDKEVKRKKKRERTETESVTGVERLESTGDGGCSHTDETVADKAESEVSLHINRTHKRSRGTPQLESTVDVLPEAEVTECDGRDAQKATVKGKKKRKKSSPVSALTLGSPALSDTSQFHTPSTETTVRSKQRKTKKRLLNPSDEFLADYVDQ